MGRKPSSSAAATADAETLAATMPADLLAASDCGGVHGHALFFDALVQLIPPRFYLPSGDEDRPWYQGLSKAAKAAMKAQSRANVKAARRARLDPSAPPASTLDLLKKSVADQAVEEEDGDDEEGKSGEEGEESGDESSSEDEDDDEVEEDEEDGDEMPIAPAAVVSEDRSVTYEELQERLRRRILELRGNRCTRPEFLNRPKKEKGKKAKGKNEKKGKGEGNKRKREDGTDDAEGKDGKKAKKVVEKPDIMYANVVIDPKEARWRKKRIKNKKKELEQAKRLQEAKQDPEKANKIAWDTARRRAAGEKVHDDPKLIKESLKKVEKRQQKHAAQWKERQKTVDNQRKEKQKKRTDNIRERAHQKKMRKIEKREKKLMRPGFEGRKDGYVNERVTNFNDITITFCNAFMCILSSPGQSTGTPGHANQVRLPNNQATTLSASGNTAGNDVCSLVLSVFHDPAIMDAMQKHIDDGYVYNTMDDLHLRSAVNG